MKARHWIAGAAVAAGGALLWANRADRGRRRRRTFYIELPPSREARPAGHGSVHFIGTATTLIRYQGFTILTDPNFLHRGEQVHIGYGMHSTRLTDPAIDFDDLPPIDFVILSHLHEDHFDKLVERRLAKDTPIFTTASADRTLRRRGFTRTYALRPWDTVEARKGDAGVKLTALPGSHGPLLVNTMLPDVIGSMLEFHCPLDFSCYRVYISGDILVDSGLPEIPRRFPHIDLALLHLGGARVMGVPVTMDARQGNRSDPHREAGNGDSDPLQRLRHFQRASLGVCPRRAPRRIVGPGAVSAARRDLRVRLPPGRPTGTGGSDAVMRAGPTLTL